MYAYIYVHTSIYTYIYKYIHVYLHVCLHMYICAQQLTATNSESRGTQALQSDNGLFAIRRHKTATHFNKLQHIAAHCSTLQHPATNSEGCGARTKSGADTQR